MTPEEKALLIRILGEIVSVIRLIDRDDEVIEFTDPILDRIDNLEVLFIGPKAAA
jgi:hypothetical protein